MVRSDCTRKVSTRALNEGGKLGGGLRIGGTIVGDLRI